MSKYSLAPHGEELFKKLFDRPAEFPVSFAYDGTTHHGFGACTLVEKTSSKTETGCFAALRFALGQLAISVELKYCAEYFQSEYTVYFANTSDTVSAVLSDIYAADIAFAGENPVLRGILGDLGGRYAPYRKDLSREDAYFESNGGRATHDSFPYFNLEHGSGGTLMALGWAGIWNGLFTKVENTTRVRLAGNPSLRSVLLPGERARTGLVVLLPYEGRNEDNAMNLWREWFLRYNMPKADRDGTPLQPFSTAFMAFDTGLPNSDGSISERHFTWRPTLEKLIEEAVVPDFRWFDAGWYSDPWKNTVETDWWGTIGSWEIDPGKWPGETFRESVDTFKKHGAKTLVWFEPERVTNVDGLVENYGYKREWAIGTDRSMTNNIGNPDCLEWTFNRIREMMHRHNVDLYREDNNANHNQTWGTLDHRETKELGLPRYGISENKSITGHYALWDKILAFCAEENRCTFLDSCASGGGRNDIESLRRSIPFMRSDLDRTTTALRLSMTTSFCQWIPFHGSSTKETVHELEASAGAGSDAYTYRASYLPIFNYSEAFTHNKALDYDNLRRFRDEWRRINRFLIGDMYVLSPWHARVDRLGWTVIAYDLPKTGESLLLGFRMEDCEQPTFGAVLPFLKENDAFVLEDEFGKKKTFCGNAITLTLNKPRSVCIYYLHRDGIVKK